MSSALEIDDVAKSFRGDRGRVLEHLSLRVEPGELVVLVGPSGSGKSTTIHLVAALDHPSAGHIRVNGRDLYHDRRHRLDRFRREEIGVIFQLHNLLPHLDAQQNVEVVMLGGRLHRRQRRERAKALLAAVHLDGREHVCPPELSGGERQRIAVARAFANDPKLVLADEPTGSLDDDNAATVVALLRDCCEHGGAVLAVSHDPRLTTAATRILHLVDGRIRNGQG
jgi:ABC-type antimicrobial peptide transport system, ATPase component